MIVSVLLSFLLAQATTPPAGKQAVVETTAGTFVMELMPQKAPNHVALFTKLAQQGAYKKTIFHRVIKYGIVQGGDPLSTDPAKSALYGTGGLNQLKAEFNDEEYTAGAVAAVLAPGKPDSGGAQFFICVTDQKGLTGRYTVFARIVDGMEVVQQISASPADANGRPNERIEIVNVTIRDTPPPVPPAFSTETVEALSKMRAVIDTSKGQITLAMRPDLAPETVRNFLRLAEAGVYDQTPFHRVLKGFMIQTGSPAHRTAPLTAKQEKLIKNLQPEFTKTPNMPGIVSMARGDDPASATSSFFICSGDCRSLDEKYAVFAQVESGMEVVMAIDAVAVNGEAPIEPVTVTKITVKKL
jgi:peptidyl-prolyl cis-trans isomerase B (cyclophilin B)